MKLLEKKKVPSNECFSLYRNKKPCLDESWHLHNELELIYVVKGSGIRFIGDDVQGFEEGELALIGAHLPHLWKNSSEYGDDSILESDVIVLHFSEDFLGVDFFEKSEMFFIKKMLTKAKRGLEFLDESLKQKISKLLIVLLGLSGFQKVHCLLEILHLLSKSSEIKQFASSGYEENVCLKDSHRLDRVYQHVLTNFNKEITLAEISEVANLGISPFCRFFKSKTQKPFSQFLNEVRIGNACKRLIDNERSIAQIAYSCGYNSQTNFNRQFKKIKGVSPKAFQKRYAVD